MYKAFQQQQQSGMRYFLAYIECLLVHKANLNMQESHSDRCIP